MIMLATCRECERALTPAEAAEDDRHCPACNRELARVARLEDRLAREVYGDDDTDPDGSQAHWEAQRAMMREGGLLDDRDRVGYVSARDVARNLAAAERDDDGDDDSEDTVECDFCGARYRNEQMQVCFVCDGVYCAEHMQGEMCATCRADDEEGNDG